MAIQILDAIGHLVLAKSSKSKSFGVVIFYWIFFSELDILIGFLKLSQHAKEFSDSCNIF